MVANVIYGGTNYRILTGIWESAGFLLQRMLDVVDSMPQGRGFDQLRSSIRAILVLSDQVCQKAGLERNQMGNEIPLQRFPQIDSRHLNRLRGLTLFSPAELKKLAVTQDELRPLIFESDQYESLLQSELGQSPLERRPLIQVGSDVRLALPTAVTVAVRRLIIDGIHGTANQPAFELALSKSYAKLFSRTPVRGAGMMPPLSFSKIGPVYAAAAQLTADIKTTLQLIFLVDGLDDYKASDWSEVRVVGDEVTNFIVSRVEEVSKEDTTGATLIVHCGWGRRVALGFPKDNPNQWDIRAITAADLATLSWCSEVDPLTILKLIDAQKALESERVDLVNMNGVLNLYAWAKSNDFHLVPHASLPKDLSTHDSRFHLVIEQNALMRLRHETLVDWDEHAIASPDGESVVVRRHTSSALFSEDRRKPLYVSFDAAARQELNAVYIASSFRLWCRLHSGEPRDINFEYRVWDAAVHWMIRAAHLVDQQCGKSIPPDLIWTIDLADFRVSQQPPTSHEIERAPSLLRTEIDLDTAQIKTILISDFAPAFADPKNTAEAAIVGQLLEGCFQLAGMEKVFQVEKRVLVENLVPNPWARHIHMIQASTYRDHFRTRVPKEVRLISQMDDATVRIGLGWRARRREDGARIEGIEECTRFLNALVDEVFKELKVRLSQLDRKEIITRMLLNHEAAEVDRDQWDRTSRAVLALHDDEEEVLTVIGDRQFRLNGTCLASRLAAEIALCECPLEGGRSPGRLDIDWINVRTALLHHLGSESDAIKWHALEPVILVSPVGEVQLSMAFGDQVVVPFGRIQQSQRIHWESSRYEQHFAGPPDSREGIGSILDERFTSAWEVEFGFSVDELLMLLDALDQLGFARDAAVFTIDERALHDALTQAVGDRKVGSFLARFSLRYRDRWDMTPDGFEAKDWYPWRFSRRLSLVSRPLVRLADSEDPDYVIAPGLIRVGVVNSLRRAFDGELPADSFDSTEMKSWIGTRSSEKGHRFNDGVASKLRENGWNVRSNLELPSVLNRKLDRDYGDIDVLAWRRGDHRVLAIEAKDVGMARSQGEIARQLYEFRGEKFESGEPDRLLRHLDRVKVLREYFLELKKNLRLPEEAGSIDPWLVFSEPVPLQFVERLSIRVTPLANLVARLQE